MKNRLAVPGHHSVADWDFEAGTAFTLSPAQYVSPPSSLYLYGTTPSMTGRTILCRLPSCQVVAEGEVRSWFRASQTLRGLNIYFRSQAVLGVANENNCYKMSLRSTFAYFYYNPGFSSFLLNSIPITFSDNTWVHWRVVFWNGIEPGVGPALAVDLYEEVAGLWVKRGATFYHTVNDWKDSATNRLGIGCTEYINQSYYFDDTELWGL